MVNRVSHHLRVHAPSPTTVAYTVSNEPHRTSLSMALLRAAVRVAIIAYVLLVNVVKAQKSLNAWNSGSDSCSGSGIIGRGAEEGQAGGLHHYVDGVLGFGAMFIGRVADIFAWWVLGLWTLIVLYLCLKRDYTEESLLVLRGMGIQTSTSSSYYFSTSSTTFIPTTQIQDIVIHEAFKGFEVRFYLAVIVEGAPEVVVVFPHLLPRRELLEEIWRGARKCLYEGQS